MVHAGEPGFRAEYQEEDHQRRHNRYTARYSGGDNGVVVGGVPFAVIYRQVRRVLIFHRYSSNLMFELAIEFYRGSSFLLATRVELLNYRRNEGE